MNIFTRIGSWVEKHFPEKITAEEVLNRFAGFRVSLEAIKEDYASKSDQIKLATILNTFMLETKKIYDSLEKLESELTTIKSQVGFGNRIAGSKSSMTPFAQRLPPVQPANSNGGNLGLKSPV